MDRTQTLEPKNLKPLIRKATMRINQDISQCRIEEMHQTLQKQFKLSTTKKSFKQHMFIPIQSTKTEMMTKNMTWVTENFCNDTSGKDVGNEDSLLVIMPKLSWLQESERERKWHGF